MEKFINVLLVEDDESHLELILDVFENKPNFKFTVAKRITEARAHIESSTPDILVSDWKLPDGRGLELVILSQEIKKFPVMVMTSYGNEMLVIEVMKAGAIDYIVKSQEAFQNLPYTIERALREWNLSIEKTKAEIAYKKSEAKYKLLIDTSSDWIWELDSNGAFTFSSPQVFDILGYLPEEILNHHFFELLDSSVDENHKLIEEKGTSKFQKGKNLELVLSHKRGNMIYLDIKINPIFNEENNLKSFVGTGRDITLKKKSESEHLRLQNLESLGILAGGIAHDFNNILTTIMGQASISIIKSKDENIKKSITSILDATKRAVGLTQQLLTFARGGTPQKTIVTIRKIIEDTAIFSLSGSNVQPEFNFNDSLNLDADPGQISQVIQNLVINSKQAMPTGGKLEIFTTDTKDDNEKPFVKIVIKDFGVGIPKEYIDKIFDPYYTTKQAGSGLGLSVCHSIIKRHDGRIIVDSVVGKGTTFEIYLPATEKVIYQEENNIPKMTQKLNILIMDDDDTIRFILKEILEELGHSVVESAEGNDTLKIYEYSLETKLNFDIVILDLTIKGGLGGIETAKILRDLNPAAKIIVSSGYAESSISSFKENGFDAKLNKPYTIDEVNETLYKLMNN